MYLNVPSKVSSRILIATSNFKISKFKLFLFEVCFSVLSRKSKLPNIRLQFIRPTTLERVESKLGIRLFFQVHIFLRMKVV